MGDNWIYYTYIHSNSHWVVLAYVGKDNRRVGMHVSLQLATKKDMLLIFKWRGIKEVYQGLYTQSRENRPLSFEEHKKWWETHKHWRKFIIKANNMKVGWLYISLWDYWSQEIGLGIGETSMWGKGIGKQALTLALDYLRNKGCKYTHTTILDSNIRSQRLFESCGYHKGERSRPGESWWLRDLYDIKVGDLSG